MTPEKRQVQYGKQNFTVWPFQPYSLSWLGKDRWYLKISNAKKLLLHEVQLPEGTGYETGKKVKGGKNNAAVIFACCPSKAF